MGRCRRAGTRSPLSPQRCTGGAALLAPPARSASAQPSACGTRPRAPPASAATSPAAPARALKKGASKVVPAARGQSSPCLHHGRKAQHSACTAHRSQPCTLPGAPITWGQIEQRKHLSASADASAAVAAGRASQTQTQYANTPAGRSAGAGCGSPGAGGLRRERALRRQGSTRWCVSYQASSALRTWRPRQLLDN